jgi:methylated-DNA-[protein]-cysteine S-methyltransferase
MNSAVSKLYTSTMNSPVGLLTIVVSDKGVRAVLWPDEDPKRVPAVDAIDQPDHPIINATTKQLDEYFTGDRQDFDVPLDPVGTEFQQSAWCSLRTIPYGLTVSYGEQAERMGDKRKARAVGAANGRNPISIIVPCHRVVGGGGELTGFAGGVESKAWLLDHERAVLGVGPAKLL